MNIGDLVEMKKSCFALTAVVPVFRWTTRILTPGTIGLIIEIVALERTSYVLLLTGDGPVWCPLSVVKVVQMQCD